MAERRSTARTDRGAAVVSIASRRAAAKVKRSGGAGGSRRALVAIAVVQAALFALSPLLAGLYGFSAWGLLSLATFATLTALLLVQPVRLGGPARLALSGLLALAVWSALSLLWAASIDAAWTELNRIGLYLVTFIVGVAVVRTRGAGWAVVGALSAGAAAVIAYVVTRLLAGTGNELFIEFRLHAPLGYVNGQAAFLLLTVWPLLAVAERARSPLVAGAGAATAVANLGLLVLTQSRAVIPALLVSTAAVLLFVPGRLRRGWLLLVVSACAAGAVPSLLDVYASRATATPGGVPSDSILRHAALWVIAAAVVAGLVWAAGRSLAPRFFPPRLRVAAAILAAALALAAVALAVSRTNDVGDRLSSEYHNFVELRVDPNATERFTSGGGFRYDLWRIALKQFESAPIKGVGAGNYVSTFFVERHQPQSVRQPHSIELQLLGELGVVGLAGFLIFVTGVLSVLVRPRVRTVGREDPGLLVACGGLFVAWLVDGSVDWVYNLPGITGMALLSGAVLTAPLGADEWQTDSSSRAGFDQLLRAIGIAVLALLAASVSRQYVADWYTQRSEASLDSDPRKSFDDAGKALALNSARMDAYYLQSAALARGNDYTGARVRLLTASTKEPFNYVPWALLGDLATRRGDSARAQAYYAEASRRNPYDVGLRDLASGKGIRAR